MTNEKTNTDATRRYHERRGKYVHMWYHSKHDADILAWLGKQSNKSGYIKGLIRDDIVRRGKGIDKMRKREDNE